MNKQTDSNFNLDKLSDTFRLRQIGQVYFSTVETISDIINASYRTAEILLFIHNFNRVYNKCPKTNKIETHLNIKNIKPQLNRLLSLNLIKRVARSYYVCTEQAPFLTDIDKLTEYVTALHNLDDFTPETFLDLMTFVHAFESAMGLETPVNNRRILPRCFCLCEDFRVVNIQTVVSKPSLACMYARDIKRLLPVIEDIYHRDTFINHVRETDKYNALKAHQLSQYAKARAYVFDYETINIKTHKKQRVSKKYKNLLDEETLEIADRAIEMRARYTDSAIQNWLYTQIVTKHIRDFNLTEAVYWADKSDCEDIDLNTQGE